jgi:putative PIN family toxin of toxin-antitoxin system
MTGRDTDSATASFTASSTMPPLRVVLDTNVLLSLYVFADSRFAPLRARLDRGEWRAVCSPACLDEFRRVLGYPQFKLDPAAQAAAYVAYADRIELATPRGMAALPGLPRCQDRDDQKFLEAARDGAAAWLVTADKALLKLARGRRLDGLFRILTPEAALTAT